MKILKNKNLLVLFFAVIFTFTGCQKRVIKVFNDTSETIKVCYVYTIPENHHVADVENKKIAPSELIVTAKVEKENKDTNFIVDAEDLYGTRYKKQFSIHKKDFNQKEIRITNDDVDGEVHWENFERFLTIKNGTSKKIVSIRVADLNGNSYVYKTKNYDSESVMVSEFDLKKNCKNVKDFKITAYTDRGLLYEAKVELKKHGNEIITLSEDNHVEQKGDWRRYADPY